MARKKICWATDLAGYSIYLNQTGVDRFQVVYGKQIDDDLRYADAAAKLGEAMMHALALEGKLDNRQRGEAA